MRLFAIGDLHLPSARAKDMDIFGWTGHPAPLAAAWEAGTSRLRPVIMTALAMIVGMAPMALGLGEGGEQNAPLAPHHGKEPA